MVSLVSVLLISSYSQVTPLYAWLLLPLICVLSMLLASPILIHTRWGPGAVDRASNETLRNFTMPREGPYEGIVFVLVQSKKC